MAGFLGKTKHLALCGGESEAVLASVKVPGKGASSVKVI